MAEIRETEPVTMVRPRRRRPILNLLVRIARNWGERHQLPLNRWLHVLGIPLSVGGVVLLFYLPWYWGVGSLVLGYLLQYLGHRAEGNDVGEWAAIKRLLGLPCVSIAPRWQPKQPTER
jgi:hypothetical protein